jgi:hypothetical protein
MRCDRLSLAAVVVLVVGAVMITIVIISSSNSSRNNKNNTATRTQAQHRQHQLPLPPPPRPIAIGRPFQRNNPGLPLLDAAANASCSAAVVGQLRSIRGKLQSQMLLIVQSLCRFPVNDIG